MRAGCCIASCDYGMSAVSLSDLDRGFCRPVIRDTYLNNCCFCTSKASHDGSVTVPQSLVIKQTSFSSCEAKNGVEMKAEESCVDSLSSKLS